MKQNRQTKQQQLTKFPSSWNADEHLNGLRQKKGEGLNVLMQIEPFELTLGQRR